ncbi:MAG: hypothetical protein IPJ66_08990 [Bacteroidetes bacterium]|nr:hypothetical protein [Bacteroidota bacterium]
MKKFLHVACVHFQNETEARIPRNSFENSLITSARQFIVQRDKKTEVVAGYHWFGRWGRDTFISLPGLTLVTQKPDLCKAVLTTMAAQMKMVCSPIWVTPITVLMLHYGFLGIAAVLSVYRTRGKRLEDFRAENTFGS